MDCSPSGSSAHGILQARIRAGVAISFSRGSSRPWDRTWVSCIADTFFLPSEPPDYYSLKEKTVREKFPEENGPRAFKSKDVQDSVHQSTTSCILPRRSFPPRHPETLSQGHYSQPASCQRYFGDWERRNRLRVKRKDGATGTDSTWPGGSRMNQAEKRWNKPLPDQIP